MFSLQMRVIAELTLCADKYCEEKYVSKYSIYEQRTVIHLSILDIFILFSKQFESIIKSWSEVSN